MPITTDVIRRAVLVAHARGAGFVELVGMAELDRSTAFRGAPMRGADLRGENLSGFDFTGATFAGADVRGTDFRRALGLTPEMFRDALVDDTTLWPSGMPGPKPTWADESGTDQYGRWVSFNVPAADGTTVVQRMRWIPPGRFIMGSPDDEPRRFKWEGPQREVTIAEGFWLFDTPCTQALWLAVMGGKNPSRFQSPTRPVEGVSWPDAQKFIRQLNALRPGLNLELPSEARWEYACRAGRAEATYVGPMEILGDNNAPVLDAIAWYGGNSGVGFELDNGYDLSGFPDRQYPDSPGGTHPVGQKAPNQWGLYDMLGNVWEWCADHWHDDYQGAPDDGSAWTGRGAAARVIRGGSWFDVARHVRAASRIHGDPAGRSDDVGFRCARVSSIGQPVEAKRRAGRSKPGERSEPAATTSPKRRR